MIPQLIFVIKVLFALEAKVMVQALSIMRMEAIFGLEDLGITTQIQISLDKISGVSEY